MGQVGSGHRLVGRGLHLHHRYINSILDEGSEWGQDGESLRGKDWSSGILLKYAN